MEDVKANDTKMQKGETCKKFDQLVEIIQGNIIDAVVEKDI